jgi:hypothetical protein
MKQLTMMFVALAAIASFPAYAAEPSATELVAKNLAARGGAEALGAIKSVRFKGNIRFPGDFDLDYVDTRARGSGGTAGSVRVDATLQGLTLVQAYDGSTGWSINPFQGRRDPEAMSADDARSLADAGMIDGPLLAARDKGSTIAYLGREDFDGTLGYKLRVSEKDGDSFVYLLDPGTYLEILVTETRKIRGAETVSESEMGDYEKVAGVYFPMSIESGPKGSTQRQKVTIDSAEANPTVAPGYFTSPSTTPVAAK